MRIRGTLNRHRKVTMVAAIAVIVVALVLSVWGSGGMAGSVPKLRSFYTIDDGATTFVDDADLYPPFERDGREAVRVYRFACGDGKEFVGYLERYTPEAKEALERARRSGAEADMELQKHYMFGREVKRPGAERWTGSKDPQYNEICTPMCRGGEQPRSVAP